MKIYAGCNTFPPNGIAPCCPVGWDNNASTTGGSSHQAAGHTNHSVKRLYEKEHCCGRWKEHQTSESLRNGLLFSSRAIVGTLSPELRFPHFTCKQWRNSDGADGAAGKAMIVGEDPRHHTLRSLGWGTRRHRNSNHAISNTSEGLCGKYPWNPVLYSHSL